MTHQDKGHYAKKHPETPMDHTICDRIKERGGEKNSLTCAAAHQIAKELDIDVAAVGIQADLLEFRITRCQMGLFGYAPEPKKIDPQIRIPAALDQALAAYSDLGSISCQQCWEISHALKISKFDLGSACEKKKLKIKPCQLGAF